MRTAIRLITAHLTLKLLALGAAVILWYFFTQASQERAVIVLPFEVALPAGFEDFYLREAPDTVTLEVAGARTEVQAARAVHWDPAQAPDPSAGSGPAPRGPRVPRAVFTLSEAALAELRAALGPARAPGSASGTGVEPPRPTEKALSVRLEDLAVPEAVRGRALFSVRLAEGVSVIFEQGDSKVVSVFAAVRAAPEEGFEFETPMWRADPAAVRVRGPRSALDELTRVATEEWHLPPVKDTQEKELPLVLPRGVRCNYERVRVSVRVRPSANAQPLREKTLSDVPVLVLRGPGFDAARYDVFVSPPTLSIKVQGAAPEIENLTKDDLDVYVNFAALLAAEGKSLDQLVFNEQGQYPFAAQPPLELSFRRAGIDRGAPSAGSGPALRLAPDPRRQLVVVLKKR